MLSRGFAYFLLGLVLLSLVPSVSWGQVLEEDKSSYVKKGFFFSVEYGPYINILKQGALDIKDGGPQASGLGQLAGIGLGFDLSEQFDLHFSFLTADVGGNGQKGGGSSTYLFNLGATIYFVKMTQLFIFAKLGAGLKLILPSDISGLGLMAHGSLGVRYYTRMRHFSIGFELLALVGIPFGAQDNLTLGLGLMPNLQYTF